MALVIKDRVLETCSSPGAGSVTLLGAVTGYQTFNAAVGTGNTCYYAIADQSGNNWEVGVGTFTAPATLGRTTVLASSNGGSLVNFAIGTQNVFLTYPAAKVVTTDTLAYPPAIGSVTPNSGAFTTLTVTQDSAFTSTGALLVSKGTTAEQPGGATTGMFRYNTSTNQFEGYSGASPGWNALGGMTIANDTTSIVAYYPLFSTATSGVVTAQYVSSTKYTFKPSTGELTSTILSATSEVNTPNLNVESGGGGVVTISAASTASSFTQTLQAKSGIIATTADIIPSGSVTNFFQAAAPTNWTKVTSNNNAAIRIVSGTGGGTGGSVDFTTAFVSQTPTGTVSVSGGSVANTTLSTSQIPSHNHLLYFSGNRYNTGTNYFAFGAGTPGGLTTTNDGPDFTATQAVAATGGGGAHTHSFTNPTASFSGVAINLAVKYLDNIMCSKD